MRKYNNALVVGKFCPLHKGHQYLLDVATELSNNLLIISYTSHDLGFPIETRRKWLKELYPKAKLVVLDATSRRNLPDDEANEYIHRQFCAVECEREQFKPDVIFSSEKYGDGFADHLSRYFGRHVTHEVVDLLRKKVPISGTQLRADPSLWEFFTDLIVRNV
jgi:HTH-type transcriptional regulator, transcriptional repressor of NAD biosynthesis genes